MSDYRYVDLDGDSLTVSEGELGAVLCVRAHDGENAAVAVRYHDLPGLIATLQAIANEATS
jgi:hypothetical protein